LQTEGMKTGQDLWLSERLQTQTTLVSFLVLS